MIGCAQGGEMEAFSRLPLCTRVNKWSTSLRQEYKQAGRKMEELLRFRPKASSIFFSFYFTSRANSKLVRELC